MPGAMSPTDGTGLFGSLRYSSTPAAAGAVNDNLPSASKYSDFADADFGGQDSNRRHSFRPVSKRYAFGTAELASALSPLPLPFRFCTKNASSMFSRKKSPVFEAKFRLPSVLSGPRDQPPCCHGPITNVFGAIAPFFSTALNNFSGPARSSASNHPPTHITAGFTFFMCGACARGAQYSSYAVCFSVSSQYAFWCLRYFSLALAIGPMRRKKSYASHVPASKRTAGCGRSGSGFLGMKDE